MILKIITTPNPLLLQKSLEVKEIDKKTQEVINNLQDTLKAQKNPEGVGIAAVQIGKLLRICLIKPNLKGKTITMINPIIIEKDEIFKDNKPLNSQLEGCLSIPRYWAQIARSPRIVVRYTDESNQIKQQEFKKFASSVVQHEIDHMDGILFTQRAIEQNSILYVEKGNDLVPVRSI